MDRSARQILTLTLSSPLSTPAPLTAPRRQHSLAQAQSRRRSLRLRPSRCAPLSDTRLDGLRWAPMRMPVQLSQKIPLDVTSAVRPYTLHTVLLAWCHCYTIEVNSQCWCCCLLHRLALVPSASESSAKNHRARRLGAAFALRHPSRYIESDAVQLVIYHTHPRTTPRASDSGEDLLERGRTGSSFVPDRGIYDPPARALVRIAHRERIYEQPAS